MSNQPNKEIATFNFHNHPVRVITINGEPWFCLVDVCNILNIKNSRRVASEMLKEDGVRKTYTIDNLNRKQEITIVNEPNLYRVIFRSNKKEATIFQNWVFEEVLPAIRKTGSYSTPTPTSVSNADWTRYLKALTIPEMATLTGHNEKSIISSLYHATHTEIEHQNQQPVLPNIPPQVQEALNQFWDTVSKMDLQQINHSRDPQVLAISLPELYSQAGEQLPQRRSMLTALKQSLIPQFKTSNHAISSSITGNTKKCWVFVMPNTH